MGIQEKIFMSVAHFLYSFTLGAYHIISIYKNFHHEFLMSEYCIIFFMFICIHGLSGKFPKVQNSPPLRRPSGAWQVLLSGNEFDELCR
jgi:hypothetical protein